MRKLFVHIGYPKTATSTLQEFVFPELENIQNLGSELSSLIQDVYYAGENACKRKHDLYKAQLDMIVSGSKYESFIYSNESLTSHSMFFRFQPHPYIWTADPNLIARKISTVFAETEVFDEIHPIIVIRKQEELVRSMYAQVYNIVFKRFRATRTFERFLDYAFNLCEDRFIVDALFFEDVVRTYDELFSPERVHVLAYEELKDNPKAFADQLGSTLNSDKLRILKALKDNDMNRRSSSAGIYLTDERSITELMGLLKLRLMRNKSLGIGNTWLVRKLSGIYVPSRKMKIMMPDRYVERCKELFSESNKRLSLSRELHLERFGYY